MQQSNAYIIGFAAALTIILGGLLSLAAVGLKERQQMSIELDNKKQILSAVIDIREMTNEEVSEFFDKRIASLVVNFDGEKIEKNDNGEPIDPLTVSISREYKKPPEQRMYPVFEFKGEDDPDKVESVILPLYGFGLWDYIWGYVALDSDLNTLRGVSFDHKGETPGLGARITDGSVQQRYEGKKLYSDDGELVSVRMLKGEGNAGISDDPHRIDGMSGATITANGVNDMLKKYVSYYEEYLQSLKKSS